MLINKKDKIIIICIIVFAFFLSAFFVYKAIYVLKYREGYPGDILYTSNVNDENKYQVFLKKNDFIDNNEINNDLSYISSLVEYIDTTFVYNYQGSENISLNYDYFIKANIISKYIEDVESATLKPVWNEEFILLDHHTGNVQNAKIDINEKLKIGLDYYNNLVSKFKEKLNLGVTSVLEIKFIININGNLKNNHHLSQQHHLLMRIPLDVKAFDITTSKNFSEKETIYSKKQPKTEASYMWAIIYIILTLGLIYIAVYIIRLVLNARKSKYRLEKERILKDYDDRIVTVSNFVNYSKLEIVNIESFDELLNMSNEIYEPIIYWEKKEKGVKEAWFSILRSKVLYRYVISNNKVK